MMKPTPANTRQVSLMPVARQDISDLVAMAFGGDDGLLTKYHISPGSLMHCVENTLGLINENADFYQQDIKFFGVNIGDNRIGYTIVIKNETHPNELYSFSIQKQYRTPEIKKQWLDEIAKLLGRPYFVSLWSKNTRAINFFQNNGFVITRRSSYLGNEIKTLSCQPED